MHITAFYANLVREEGDVSGVVMNMAHEGYHVLQKVAQRRAPGLALVADSADQLPPAERLRRRGLVGRLASGTEAVLAPIGPLPAGAAGGELPRPTEPR